MALSDRYTYYDWREDLKRVLFLTGIDAKDTTFLFTDTQIRMEAFLEDINNLLNTGEVANLFMPEELEKVRQPLSHLIPKHYMG
jgi:dynein heavy chain